MNAHTMDNNTSVLLYVEDSVDYGYEDHSPDPRSLEIADAKPDLYGSYSTFRSPSDFSTNSIIRGTTHMGDATEVSQSPSQSMKNSWSRGAFKPNPATFSGDADMFDSDDDSGEDSSDYDAVIAAAAIVGENVLSQEKTMQTEEYPPMPADRQARKQRSFHRRGGEVHGALLKSAVMASMSLDLEDSNDEDEKFPGTAANRFRNVRRESCQSSISLQSLQDALRSETSPRKRARRGVRRASFDDEDDHLLTTANSSSHDANHNRDMAEASDLFDTMRVGSGDSLYLFEDGLLHETCG